MKGSDKAIIVAVENRKYTLLYEDMHKETLEMNDLQKLLIFGTVDILNMTRSINNRRIVLGKLKANKNNEYIVDKPTLDINISECDKLILSDSQLIISKPTKLKVKTLVYGKGTITFFGKDARLELSVENIEVNKKLGMLAANNLKKIAEMHPIEVGWQSPAYNVCNKYEIMYTLNIESAPSNLIKKYNKELMLNHNYWDDLKAKLNDLINSVDSNELREKALEPIYDIKEESNLDMEIPDDAAIVYSLKPVGEKVDKVDLYTKTILSLINTLPTDTIILKKDITKKLRNARYIDVILDDMINKKFTKRVQVNWQVSNTRLIQYKGIDIRLIRYMAIHEGLREEQYEVAKQTDSGNYIVVLNGDRIIKCVRLGIGLSLMTVGDSFKKIYTMPCLKIVDILQTLKYTNISKLGTTIIQENTLCDCSFTYTDYKNFQNLLVRSAQMIDKNNFDLEVYINSKFKPVILEDFDDDKNELPGLIHTDTSKITEAALRKRDQHVAFMSSIVIEGR